MSSIRRGAAAWSLALGGSRRRSAPARVRWGWLARSAAMAGGLVVMVILLLLRIRTGHYASDFHGGAWRAGRAVLGGRSPYLAPDVRLLAANGSAFIPPPVLAFIAAPFALLPFPVAAAAWSVTCGTAFLASFWLLGVRDWRFMLVAVCSCPFVASLLFGQPDGLLCLLVAIAWRWRDHLRGAVAVGVLVAAKLVLWPLILWLFATKRLRLGLTASIACAAALGTTWALIGFAGLGGYPQLLAADAHAFAALSYSTFALWHAIGCADPLAHALSVAAAACVAAALVFASRDRDRGGFFAAVAAGLLASPLLEMSYLSVLFVILALVPGPSRPASWWALVLWATLPGVLPPSLRIVQILLPLLVIGLVARRVSRVAAPACGSEPRDLRSPPVPAGVV